MQEKREVESSVFSIKNQPTKYLDKNGQEQTTNERDLSNEDIKIITQIGFCDAGEGIVQAVRMPKSIEQVPNPLPSEITSLGDMFWEAKNFNQDISNWDVSRITNLGGMFVSTESFNQDLSKWDVSNVNTMDQMFVGANKFNNGGQPLTWGEKTKNITSMNHIFYKAKNFNQDFSGWNVSRVKNYNDFALESGLEHEKEKQPIFNR